MKFKVIAADPLCGRLLTLELERLGLTPAREGTQDFELLAAEGLTELPKARRLEAAVLVDCGLLSAGLPDTVQVLLLDRPFALAELRAFVKRLQSDGETSDEPDLWLDEEDQTVTYNDDTVKLTGREFALFSYLHARPGQTITRGELLRELWQDETARDSNIIDVYVKYIRTKLDERFGVRFLRAVRGEGYVYEPDNGDKLKEVSEA
ncbi:MAG: winged helix-turn-helix transcriptional regulator [Clostridia bacterium]|nr:winged helix-turn-helix transcriptional regulator [Clostridia bacterium]